MLLGKARASRSQEWGGVTVMHLDSEGNLEMNSEEWDRGLCPRPLDRPPVSHAITYSGLSIKVGERDVTLA